MSSVSPACRNRRLNGAVPRNNRIKRVARVGAWTDTLKNPTKYLWRWEPDCRSNLFFIQPIHLCAVTYMTEISLNVTLNNQIRLTSLLTFIWFREASNGHVVVVCTVTAWHSYAIVGTFLQTRSSRWTLQTT